MKTTQYIVTAGGTREPIDEVRYIGNASTGQLGALIADKAHSMGHEVVFLHGQGSALPECRNVILNQEFTTSSDLKGLLRHWVLKARKPAVLVHCAAVSDYAPEKTEGKISSDKDELTLRLKRTEKLVDFIKTWNPNVYLVKFKLESNCSKDKLLQIAARSGRHSGADLVVANDTGSAWTDRHKAYILKDENLLAEVVGKKEIAAKLVETIDGTVNQNQDGVR